MLGVNAYLTFNGNCTEAMKFYAKCLNAELHLMPFSETPCNVPKEEGYRIAHAKLIKGSALLMASDTLPGMPFVQGNNFSVSMACESLHQIEQFFSALSQDGKVTMALQDTFWGARFGMLTDRFGVNWMFNYELPKK